MVKTVEITIPILNEETTLNDQVRKIHKFKEKNLQDFGSVKLVLADNGSTDSTPELARKLANQLSDVEYLRLEQRGVGLALKASWTRSEADIVGYMDLDLATDLRHLRPALGKIISENAEIVTGSRLAKGAKVLERKPFRTFTSICFNYIVKLIFKTKFSDGMCGFKFMQRCILERLMQAGAQSDGWFFATEILITGERLNHKVEEIPVIWTDDPNSKVKVVKLAMEYLRAMSVLRRRLNKFESRVV
jgi:glycosyltransferase involved in cell wall biosynthesis